MPVRTPKACLKTQRPQEDIYLYALSVHDGLLASIATFPTPPVLPAALLILINNYGNALTDATDGSKQQVAAKNAAKFDLVNALRVDVNYVNQIVFNLIAGGMSYEDASDLILQTGYALSENPAPAGPLPAPVVRKFSSPKKGEFYILCEKVPNAYGYAVKLSDTTAATPEVVYTFANTRILIQGLISGHEYNAQIASIGANPTRNYDVQVNQIII